MYNSITSLTTMNINNTDNYQHIASHINAIWNNKDVQLLFNTIGQLSSKTFDNLSYFFNDINRILSIEYTLPSKDDINICLIHTPTIEPCEMTIKHDIFGWNIYDIGGLHDQQKKWVNYVNDIDGLVYFISLTHYKYKLFEDNIKHGNGNGNGSLLMFKTLICIDILLLYLNCHFQCFKISKLALFGGCLCI